MEKKKFTVKLSNEDKIEQLLQETYNLACQQYKALQDEINKISNSTVIKDLDMDGKEKYAKIMNNYIVSQQKSITQKYDIAKLMAEVLKSKGNIDEALNNTKKSATTLDLNKLRQLAQDANTSTEKTEEYTLKK